MKDLVQVDDNNNNKTDMNGLKNGTSDGAIVKVTTNGYATATAAPETSGSKCSSCDKGE